MNLSEQGVSFEKAVIASGAAISQSIKFGDGVYPVGIIHPIMTTSTAIIFQVSDDGTTFYPMFDATGTRVTVVIAPAAVGYTILSPSDFAGVKYLKVEVADNQAAERTLKLASRGV